MKNIQLGVNSLYCLKEISLNSGEGSEMSFVGTTVQLRMELERDRKKKRTFVKEICHVCSTGLDSFKLFVAFIFADYHIVKDMSDRFQQYLDVSPMFLYSLVMKIDCT